MTPAKNRLFEIVDEPGFEVEDRTSLDWSQGAPADEVSLYFERIRQSTDPAELEGLAKAVGRELAPQQLHDLYHRVRDLGTNDLLDVFRSRTLLWQYFIRRGTPPFKNTPISPCIRFLESEGEPRSRKVLLVMFAGVNGDAFLPLVRLLMKLPEGKFDVLLLRPANGGDFPQGVPGAGDDFFQICKYVETYLPQYAGSAAMGASLGGLSALRAATILNMQMGVSLAGRYTDMRRLNRLQGVSGFDPLCTSLSTPSSPKGMLVAYHSALNPRDAIEADKMRAMNPNVCVRPVPDSDRHNVCIQMMQDGSFGAMVEEMYRLGTAGKVEAEAAA